MKNLGTIHITNPSKELLESLRKYEINRNERLKHLKENWKDYFPKL